MAGRSSIFLIALALCLQLQLSAQQVECAQVLQAAPRLEGVEV